MLQTVIWRTLRQFTIAFVVVLTILLIAAHQINSIIFSPQRRTLYDYHLQRINSPAEYGLAVRSHACLDGKVPCLLVEPDAAAGPSYEGRELRGQLTAKGVALPAYGQVWGTVFLLHGRNGRKEHLLPVAERLVAVGLRSIIVDLPAHGQSPIKATSFGQGDFERTLPKRVLQEMRVHFDVPDEPTIVWGTSMGGAFALSAASETDSGFDGAVILSSFASLDEVLEAQIPSRWAFVYPYVAPLLDLERLLANKPRPSQMQPERDAQKVTIPTVVVHGESDYYVRPEQGRRLYSALQSQQKHWVTVPYGRHRNVLSRSTKHYAEVTEWLIRALVKS
ncbi:alpha/beta fold hydrolase [Leucothrix sargassi]|nr:alpha/beta fold hydrolase [Leucothrix sargassi]